MSEYIQGVLRGKFNILVSHSIGHSKHKSMCVYACVLFRTVSEIELFHCTVSTLYEYNVQTSNTPCPHTSYKVHC
jgi:hypothetical protein